MANVEIPDDATVIIQKNDEKQPDWQPPHQGNAHHSEMDKRTLGTVIAGLVSGFVANLGADFWLNDKMRTFEGTVRNLAREDIMKGAGSLSGGGIGAGIDAAGIEMAHRLNLINSGKYPLQKFIYNIGGQSAISMAVAVAVGGVAARMYYLSTKPEAKPQVANAPMELAKNDNEKTIAKEQIKEPAIELTEAQEKEIVDKWRAKENSKEIAKEQKTSGEREI